MKKLSLNRKNLGFTLIELLVVVAIIGILASVVLASLNTARSKGADAATKSNLANMRAQAAIYYDDSATGNGNYSTATFTFPLTASCTPAGSVFVDPVFVNAIAAITTSAGTAPICSLDGTSGGKADKWAMSAVTKSGTASTWCVDSTGASVTAKVAANGVCS